MADAVFGPRYGVMINIEEYHKLREEMKTILLDRSQYATTTLAEKMLRERYPLSFLYLEVVTPELLAITEEWYAGKRPFTDVSGAWEQLEILLPILRRRLAEMTPSKPVVLIANVEGNEHVLGAGFLADMLTEARYPVNILPAPTRRTDILDAAVERNPACIALSISVPDQIEELQDTVQALRDQGYSGNIAAGGSGLPVEQTPHWDTRGIDWIGTDPLEFIAWLDREVNVRREAA